MNLSALLSSDILSCSGQMKSASPISQLTAVFLTFTKFRTRNPVPNSSFAILLLMTRKGH